MALLSATVTATPAVAAAPTFELPFDCGQTGWEAGTTNGHFPSVYNIDFNRSPDDGQPVRASADGVVVSPAYSGSASNPIGIDHDGSGLTVGWATLYLHMRDTLPNGTPVKRGQVIGYVSNVGADGVHLHYEQRNNWQHVPATFSNWSAPYNQAMKTGLGVAVPASGNCGTPPPAANPTVTISPSVTTETGVPRVSASSGWTPSRVNVKIYQPDGREYQGGYTKVRTVNGSGQITDFQFPFDSGDPYGTYRVVFTDAVTGKSASANFTFNRAGAPATPTYTAAFVSQSAWRDAAQTQPWPTSGSTVSARAGETGYFRFQFRNTGTATWSRSGANPTRLGTSNPRDAVGLLHNSRWISTTRAALLVEASVAPGGIGTFLVPITAPAGTTSTRQTFEPVVDGKSWLGPQVWLVLNTEAVLPPPVTTTTTAPTTTVAPTTTAAPTTTRAPSTTVAPTTTRPTTTSPAPAGPTTTTKPSPTAFEVFAASPNLNGAHADILRLYWAAFDREPDVPGATWWVDAYNTGSWPTLVRIAEHFAVSPEFIATYGTLSNSAFVDAIYLNVLDRPGEPGGRAFWIRELDNRTRTRGEVLADFSYSAEFRSTHPLPSDNR